MASIDVCRAVLEGKESWKARWWDVGGVAGGGRDCGLEKIQFPKRERLGVRAQS